MIPTRDEGVRLSCLLCRPIGLPEGKKLPCLITLHYAGDHPDPSATQQPLARHGFAVADVVFRGCHRSEGMADGGIYVTLANDGFDVCEWLAAQPWCTGQVGSFGGSQAGFAQNLLASTAPPSLVCQYQQDTGMSLFHEAYRHGGGGQRGPAAFGGVPSVHRGLNNKDGETMSEWAEHLFYDEYWAQQDATPHIAKNNTPCCTIGSWHDFMCQGSIATFVGKQHLGAAGSRGQQILIAGPWTHGGGGRIDANSSGDNSAVTVGELDFPQQAAFPFEGGMRAHMAQYFRQQMGMMSAAESVQMATAIAPATVQYYVMGAVGESGAPGNEWRTATDFPVPATPTKYYLVAGGGLSLTCPAAGPGSKTEIVADPAHRADNGTGSVGFPGARDARVFEAQQPYVSTFTSELLEEPVEWTGAVHAAMKMQLGEATDCDCIVRISDVYPDGRS